MGQRLVLYISIEDETLGKYGGCLRVYYHWSGYTSSTIHEINKIGEEYARLRNERPWKRLAAPLIQAIYNLGGSIACSDEDWDIKQSEKELEFHCFPEKLPLIKWKDRDAGLIGITEFQERELDGWMETSVQMTLAKDGSLRVDRNFAINSYDITDYCEIYEVDEEELVSELEDLRKFVRKEGAAYQKIQWKMTEYPLLRSFGLSWGSNTPGGVEVVYASDGEFYFERYELDSEAGATISINGLVNAETLGEIYIQMPIE